MTAWASVIAVISGLAATVMLAAAVCLAQAELGARRGRIFSLVAGGGLAASAIFGGLLVLRLLAELSRAAAVIAPIDFTLILS
ncbi:MAG TPA: hypothetical protein VK101_11225 [Limnochordia bacterium]|nr:hypothetical protein [Limnochordia bacterium]